LREAPVRSVVTGAAGFIGSHLCERLVELGHTVIGIDCLTDYYPRELKQRNLKELRRSSKFRFLRRDLTVADLLHIIRPVDYVFHFAAQPGVRGSWGKNFGKYVGNNILATQAVLEALKRSKVRKLIYASSSSIYGEATPLPTPEDTNPKPVSPYGITKLAAENLCRIYGRNFTVPTVILRYFTVYGPRQRPDMAFHRFIDSALSGSTIVVYGDGNASRDFTYVADAVEATILAMEKSEPGQVFNVGSSQPITVNDAIAALRDILGREVIVRHEEAQRGDVTDTHADINKARTLLGFKPSKNLRQGLREQVRWQEEAIERSM
jgi:nucleoside-diphosphate-sugar epimerase